MYLNFFYFVCKNKYVIIKIESFINNIFYFLLMILIILDK